MELVRSHGRAAASFQILTSGVKYWFAEDACVAYAEVGGSWITVGGVLAAPEREHAITEEFAREAKRRGKRVRFYATESELPADSSLALMQIGEQPVWDPRQWPKMLPKRMRGQLRRDLANRVVDVREAPSTEIDDATSTARRGIDAVIAHWLETRKTAPLDFLLRLNPYQLSEERRFFVAEKGGVVVGAIIAVPVYAKHGWFLETILRDPAAPNGTVELMFDFAMRSFASEGCPYLTFGLCPLTGTPSDVTNWIRRCTRSLYNFDGLRKFKGKLGPSSWQPVYLGYPKNDPVPLVLFDVMRAFVPGGLLRFVWNTLVHRASVVALVLAGLLVPWTLALSLADTARWFPSHAVQAGWVLLNLMMLAGLLVLARGWRKRLATALSGLAMFDFVASTLQFASYNAAEVEGSDFLLTTAGIVGPLLTSLFLWNSRDRTRLYAPGENKHPSRDFDRAVRQRKEREALSETAQPITLGLDEKWPLWQGRSLDGGGEL